MYITKCASEKCILLLCSFQVIPGLMATECSNESNENKNNVRVSKSCCCTKSKKEVSGDHF